MSASIIPKPLQKTLFVVRRAEYKSAPVVYAGNSAKEAHDVAKGYQNATVTFKTESAFLEYVRR